MEKDDTIEIELDFNPPRWEDTFVWVTQYSELPDYALKQEDKDLISELLSLGGKYSVKATRWYFKHGANAQKAISAVNRWRDYGRGYHRQDYRERSYNIRDTWDSSWFEEPDIFEEANQHAPQPGQTKHPFALSFDIARIDPRIVMSVDVVKAKQRLRALNSSGHLDRSEKIEFGRLSQLVELHMRGLNDFDDMFLELTGKRTGVLIGTWSDDIRPTDRYEVAKLINEWIDDEKKDRILK